MPVKVNRKLKVGQWPIPVVFPGLERDPHFKRLFANDSLREKVLKETLVNLIPEDAYAYIDDERGWVNLGLGYLKTGEERILYLDILHELTHFRQWHEGKELWDPRYNYLDRPTEVEACEVAVDVARKLGMSDREIGDCLRVEWTSREEHERLCRRLGVRLTDSRAQLATIPIPSQSGDALSLH